MSKKSTATKTTATTKSAATKTSRKSSATRTKLPAEKSEAIESTVSPVEVTEVAPAQPVTATEVTTEVTTEVVAEAQPETQPVTQPEEPAIIEAMAPPSRTLSREEFEAIVRREAYMRAQQRGFRNGSPLEDWVAAEIEVRARLSAEGASVPTA